MADPTKTSSTVALQPTFIGALRGLWLFTWRSRLTWRRLPNLLLGLFVLPVLVYVTTLTIQSWSRRQSSSPIGDPSAEVAELIRRLTRPKQPLRPEQVAQLHSIFIEEYRRADRDLGETEPGERNQTRQNAVLKDCYERIRSRAETVLDE